MIDILLATYNASEFIRPLLDSIFSQTESRFRLIIQDDASDDNTAEIIGMYREKYRGRISFYQNNANSKSAKANFFSMIAYSSNPYIMFCDQDDVWLPDKIRITLEEMQKIEQTNLPALIHTDLSVVDEKLRLIHPSLMKMQKLNPNATEFNRLLVQNFVTGCTVMLNRAAIDACTVIPENAVMHDWWFALIASAFGKISFVSKPTILYRQHPNNQVGAKNIGNLNYLISRLANIRKVTSAIAATYLQTEEFLRIYGERLPHRTLRNIAQDYADFPKINKISKIKRIFKHRLFKHGLIRIAGQLLLS